MITGSNLGTINFTTGARVSGGMGGNATFAPGGSIVITANGSGGLQAGVLFTGTFTGTTSWTLTTVSQGGSTLYYYTLNGTISGTFSNGQTVSGQAITISVLTMQTFHGNIGINQGNMNVLVTPEPGYAEPAGDWPDRFGGSGAAEIDTLTSSRSCLSPGSRLEIRMSSAASGAHCIGQGPSTPEQLL